MTASRLLSLSLLLAACARPPEELDDFGPLPQFSLVNQDGKPVNNRTLAGTVWAANFLFTSCPTACPPLAKATAQLQGQIAAWASPSAPAKLVSISVDPVTDTPEVLRAFGAKYGADPARWWLLTGNYETMERLVVQGFMQALVRGDRNGTPEQDAAAMARATPIDTAHSLRFALVDQAGHLRAFYSRDGDDPEKLLRAMRWLADHPAKQ